MVGWGSSCASFTELVTNTDPEIDSRYRRHRVSEVARKGRPTRYKMRETLKKEEPSVLKRDYTMRRVKQHSPQWREVTKFVSRYIMSESKGFRFSVGSINKINYEKESLRSSQSQHGFNSAYKFVGGTRSECHEYITDGVPTTIGPVGNGIYLPFVNLDSSQNQTLDPLLCTNNGLVLLLCSVQSIPSCRGTKINDSVSSTFLESYKIHGRDLPCLFVRDSANVVPRFWVSLEKTYCGAAAAAAATSLLAPSQLGIFNSCHEDILEKRQQLLDAASRGDAYARDLKKVKAACTARSEYLKNTINRKANMLIESIHEAAKHAIQEVTNMEEQSLATTLAEAEHVDSILEKIRSQLSETDTVLDHFVGAQESLADSSVGDVHTSNVSHAVSEFEFLRQKHASPPPQFGGSPSRHLSLIRSHDIISSPAELTLCRLSHCEAVPANQFRNASCSIPDMDSHKDSEKQWSFPSVSATVGGCPTFDP
eukprot:TRINITY_DN30588_c0_g1_i1.p1 TRINITY_DN30588_c0_g1~~TRINITY_DN30588_c0_g1_i1.p1  ORF type:complete len:481 (+),score=70.10 TRINITY_DN30588_c0_g1_i1:32-1474(+)